MPYYTGDYYVGDYYNYQAGGLFGSIFKGIKGAVGGFLSGGPLGAIKGAAGAVLGRGSSSTAMVPVVGTTPPILRIQGKAPDVPKGTPGAVKQPGLRGAVERVLPGGQSGYVPGSSVGAGAPPGFHWNKSYSYAQGLPAGSFLVRNRQMNPGNARALRRGMRRQQAFIALARRALKGSHYTIATRGGAKRGRRR